MQRLTGPNYTAGPGEYPVATNFRTLSIAVPPGYAVVVYEFYQFQGRSLVLSQSQVQLPQAFSNAVYSFKVSAGEHDLLHLGQSSSGGKQAQHMTFRINAAPSALPRSGTLHPPQPSPCPCVRSLVTPLPATAHSHSWHAL